MVISEAVILTGIYNKLCKCLNDDDDDDNNDDDADDDDNEDSKDNLN